MTEGSDCEEVETGEGREIKGRGGEAGGSVGHPFESWKQIQTADMLMDSQTALCVFLYCPVIQPHYMSRTGNTYCTSL